MKAREDSIKEKVENLKSYKISVTKICKQILWLLMKNSEDEENIILYIENLMIKQILNNINQINNNIIQQKITFYIQNIIVQK